jgi:hypothetical protein
LAATGTTIIVHHHRVMREVRDATPESLIQLEDRYTAPREMARRFTEGHMDAATLPVSSACAALAEEMINIVPDSAELAAGLRKLLEAKEHFIRATISARRTR